LYIGALLAATCKKKKHNTPPIHAMKMPALDQQDANLLALVHASGKYFLSGGECWFYCVL